MDTAHTEQLPVMLLMLMDKMLAQFQSNTHGHALQHVLENMQLVLSI